MINTSTIPTELRQTPQWVLWKAFYKDGKLTKLPITVDGTPASSTNPDDWSPFDTIASNLDHFDGAGFVFTASDPYCGIDIDDCIKSNGTVHPIAKEIVEFFNSYTEISPSGTGLKIFIKGRKTTSRCKISIPDSPVSIELYDSKRYFTVTSDVFEDSPLRIRECQSELEEFGKMYFPEKKGNINKVPKVQAKKLSGQELDDIIKTIRKSRDGINFTELFDQGDMSSYGNDHSKSDFALLCIISKYCNRNPIAMESIFSRSALGERDKWVNRKDYRERTIKRVLVETAEEKGDVYSSILKDHYILGKKIIRVDLTLDGGFHLSETSKEILNIKVGANNKEQKMEWWQWLVENKEIKFLEQVESVSDPNITKPYYEWDTQQGILRVHVAPLQPDVKDNDMIERYLDETFGEYKPFLKQYMAAYAYTNFKPLPTIICYGPRGTSKSTFAEMVSNMFPRLYCDWSGDVSNYTPEAEKKLAIVEENATVDKQQYKVLKKYTGQTYLNVNKKYQPIYKVRNNLSVILISNDNIPLYVERDEMPTSSKNNQFFVWKFTNVIQDPDPEFKEKIKRRLGHYVQSELRSVYESLDLTASRYTIEVPITPFERQLFNNSVTNIELNSEEQLDMILRDFSSYLNHRPQRSSYYNQSDDLDIYFGQLLEKRLPIPLVRHYIENENNLNECVQYLQKRHYIKDCNSKRKKVNGNQFRYYDILNWKTLDDVVNGDTEGDRLFVPSRIASPEKKE